MIEQLTWTRLDDAADAVMRARKWRAAEREPVTHGYATIDDELPRLGPSIVATPHGSLGIVRTRRKSADVLAPDGRIAKLPLADLRTLLCEPVESRLATDVDRVLDAAGVQGGRRARSRAAILRELAGSTPVGEVWLLRPPLEDALATARESRLLTRCIAFGAANLAQTVLFIVSWWLLGLMAFDVRSLDTLFAVWLLSVLSIIPLRAAETFAARAVLNEAGALMKRRLLLGALKLTPDEVLGNGVGTFFGHILEAGAVEALGVTGAFAGISSVVGAVCATFILAGGAGGSAHAALYGLWMIATALATVAYARARGAWTEARFALTGQVVENMIGHKTRAAQKEPAEWTEEEDRRLAQQMVSEAILNRRATALDMLRRVWPWAGLLALAPSVVAGDASASGIAVGAGGVLLGGMALSQWVESSARIAAAAIAWRRVAPFWRAAGRIVPVGSAALEPVLDATGDAAIPLLQASSIGYRHARRDVPALVQVDLSVREGDRVLVSGPSGSGKSTLAAILSGVRPLQSGLLFFRGLDMASVGLENWRRRVLLAPQFHANHIFVGTLAYNLLLGRGWPATPEDLDEARAVCHGIGLGPLLARMPLGLNQPVGETGWKLSHGERMRVFLARALLQNASVTILDETFAALDPETVSASMRYVLERAKTVVVVAHV